MYQNLSFGVGCVVFFSRTLGVHVVEENLHPSRIFPRMLHKRVRSAETPIDARTCGPMFRPNQTGFRMS